MVNTSWQDPSTSDIVSRVVASAGERLYGDPVAFERFAGRYFARVPRVDLERDTAESLAALAAAHLRLAAERPEATPRVRVFNPDPREDGWQSDHSAILIVTDDMPFLVDSITAELGARELPILRVIHPVFRVLRDGAGRWLGLAEAQTAASVRAESRSESFISVDIARLPAAAHGELAVAITGILGQVRAVVADREAMESVLGRVRVAIAAGGWPGADATGGDPGELAAFLDWLRCGNFTFLGYRAYRHEADVAAARARIEPGSGFGLLRDPAAAVFEDLADGAPLPPMAAAFVVRPTALAVAKSDRRSPVHRRVPMDVIVVKRFDADERVVGLHLFAGLFTAQAYAVRVRDVPLIRRKLARVLDAAGFEPHSHDGRALVHAVQTFPRDELFQFSDDALLRVVLGLLDLQHRPRPALFVRVDEFGRYAHALVYVPRDRFNTIWRETVQSLLERAFGGTVSAHYGLVGEGPLARLQVLVQTKPGAVPAVDLGALEQQLAAASRTWSDDLLLALNRSAGEDCGRALFVRYRNAFPAGYTDRFTAEEAIADIDLVEAAMAGQELGLALTHPSGSDDREARIKVVHADEPVRLSRLVPLLENLGWSVIEELPHAIRPGDGSRSVIVHDIGVQTRRGGAVDVAAVRERFEDGFLAVFSGRAENDGLGALILEAGLDWRQVSVLRAYLRYLRQARIGFGQAYLERALLDNLPIAAALVRLFEAMFRPGFAGDREEWTATICTEIDTLLDGVGSAVQDRILRRFRNAIVCTLRTNAFQRDVEGRPKPCLAFKLDSSRLDDLPLPRPLVEVFVCSPRVEGIHLRGGRVARGGIRWSDRREDFRTEVLGLMKAQMVKNAVIVPTGAKGGFFVKQPVQGGDRDAVQAEGIACYRAFIGALLDLTDTIRGGRVVPPNDVVRRDGDDPYLVVAADKGTATFSDIANALATEHGFWLGDAFASGGSRGYDHKRIGITARGAWVSVERHFREAGIAIDLPFTVVGVGDMSGDVFGNGMLLSPHIQLIAAFDHRHIMIDPDPDAAASFAERQRLFALPRSSWADYDASVLSPGGAIFSRAAKAVAPSARACERFGLPAGARITPEDLVRAALKAKVDLLWLGGVGTFVKAAAESHDDVGDRANDRVRVDGRDLGARVVCEGANLGLTQLGRVEYARTGGSVNTDFIDNSAGVDCSDHEVNIKILLDAMVAEGRLTGEERDALLIAMTDDVTALVLRDNYLQAQAISVIEVEGPAALDSQARFLRTLERTARLDRAVEFLPDDEALAERAQSGRGLTRPEIAVLFSHAKMWLGEQILASQLPDDDYLVRDVASYFPALIRDRFVDAIVRHPLRRELATMLMTNSVFNRMGLTFITEVVEETNASAVAVARAYVIARDIFKVRALWEAIEPLDGRVPADVVVMLYRSVSHLLARASQWFLRRGQDEGDIGAAISAFDVPVAALMAGIRGVLPAPMLQTVDARADEWVAVGVPADLARSVAELAILPAAGDIVRLAASRGAAVGPVARLYFAVGERFGFSWLRERVAEQRAADAYWPRLALAAVVDELDDQQRRLTERIIVAATPATVAGGDEAMAAVDAWSATVPERVQRWLSLLAELQTAVATDLAMLSVALRQLRALTDS